MTISLSTQQEGDLITRSHTGKPDSNESPVSVYIAVELTHKHSNTNTLTDYMEVWYFKKKCTHLTLNTCCD